MVEAKEDSTDVSNTVPHRPPFEKMFPKPDPPTAPTSSPAAHIKGNGTANCNGKASAAPHADEDVPPSVARFQTYLRINTAQPKPDYAAATEWFRGQAQEIGLEFRTHDCVPGKTFSVLTLVGRNPSAPTLFLNSHIDVVPVDEEHWTSPPFAAERRPNGDIVARGAQDMKIVGVQYLEAIRVLKARGWVPEHTIHVCFTPDEEIGGIEGMMLFLKTDFFKELNIGFSLDEGISNLGNEITVFYAERTGCHTLISAHGKTGHGSQFIAESGPDKLLRLVDKFNGLRREEETKLKTSTRDDGSPYALGDVTTLNLVSLKSGKAPNIVPGDAEALFDIRVTPRTDYYAFRSKLESFAREESGVHLTFYGKPTPSPLPELEGPQYGPYWSRLDEVAKKRGLVLKPEIFPAGSDARYLRGIGIPALGISYLKNTPVLLHDHDEYVNDKLFLEGIDFYVDLLPALTSLEA
ncbi:aminoacylase-1A-like protein [Gonapodya prolifera JEL478]|uniref:Aminoacylase-1A-like protein n=1 Tax=Gonapodya prolifera (strain JEL478) TaxID=1344416 RepID=A0A139AQ25_GONPJ|nr:aminoacylase-1A-like protein [Gonapodya prolifera JEL478]|eukprot:KXS18754.1 aminoacylase-1A-like protein [Gonapodya prolifera JEL478]